MIAIASSTDRWGFVLALSSKTNHEDLEFLSLVAVQFMQLLLVSGLRTLLVFIFSSIYEFSLCPSLPPSLPPAQVLLSTSPSSFRLNKLGFVLLWILMRTWLVLFLKLNSSDVNCGVGPVQLSLVGLLGPTHTIFSLPQELWDVMYACPFFLLLQNCFKN